MKKAIIIGGSNGLGSAILNEIHDKYDEVTIIDVSSPCILFENVDYVRCDLSKPFNVEDLKLNSADTLIITAGIGAVKKFEKITYPELKKLLNVNLVSIAIILRTYYESLLRKNNIKCFVMSSIAGLVSSPLLSVYSASKAAIAKLCESLNIELEKSGSANRITCGFATSFAGSSFNGKETDITLLAEIASKCVYSFENSEVKVFLDDKTLPVFDNYLKDEHSFGLKSYEYKLKNNRLIDKKTITIGYLSGTFDLFHIGHLNLLKRAKEHCDYLIVGVHEDGSWKGKDTFIPFEERVAIIKSIKYVDEVHKSFREDSDAWNTFHFDKLFVGSDYKGSERFKRYEEFFKNKGVEIVYFPYTTGTSSTQLRELIQNSYKK